MLNQTEGRPLQRNRVTLCAWTIVVIACLFYRPVWAENDNIGTSAQIGDINADCHQNLHTGG